jgi:hypothetical protein
MTELTIAEFVTKLCIAIVPLMLVYAWVAAKTATRRQFLFAGVCVERDAVGEGKATVCDLQDHNWAANAGQVQGYSAITVAIVLLVVVFIIEKDLNTWSEAYMNIIILVAGASCLAYAFSLQFWNCALDRARAVSWLLSQRKPATTLQVVGWHRLYLSVILAVSYANTWCGVFLSVIGALGLAAVMKMKFPKCRLQTGDRQ